MTNKINLGKSVKKYYPLGFLFLIIFGFLLIQEAKAKAISVGTASDNIGIGTDTPGTTYRLNVNGNSNITGTLNVTGGITGASLGSTLLSASNVSAGTFGSNSGGGNYSFPGTLNVTSGVVSATVGGNTNPGSTAFQAREYNYGTTDISHIEQNAPRVGFHWGNRYWGQITYFNSIFNFRNSDLSAYAPIAASDGSFTGSVGVGTITPATGYKLDVRGNLFLSQSSANLRINLDQSGVRGWYIDNTTSGNLAFTSGDGGGNVGIGLTSPQAKLQIAGNFSNVGTGVQDGNDRPGLSVTGYYPQIVLMAGGQGNTNHGSTISLGSFDSGTSGAFKSWTLGTPGINATWMDIGYGTNTNPHLNGISGYGTTVMRLQNNGNVGIGTTGPQVRLDVQGGTDGHGANIYGMWTPDGNSLIRNWALNDGTNNYGASGQGSYTTISDAPMGSKTMRYSTNTYIRNQQWIPVDITKTYKVSLWGRTISGTPNNYISLTQATYDLSQPVNGGWGNPYWGRVNEAFPNTWTYYSMTIGPSGSGANYSWSSDTRYVQLGALMIYTGSGVCEITGYKIEEVPSTIAGGTTALGNLTVNGTITGAMSGTLNAANLSSGTFGANTGGGNYAFPGSVDISGTVTARTYGTYGDVQMWRQNSNLAGNWAAPGMWGFGWGDASRNIYLKAVDGSTANLNVNGVISAATGASGGFRTSTYTAGQNLIWAFGNASAYGFSYKQGATDDIRFHFGDFNNPQLLVNQSGNVGIGTTIPSARLDVRGNTTVGDVLNLGNLSSVSTSAYRGITWESNFSDGNYAIFKPAGGWTQPLHIAFYTGIKIGADTGYGGTRFYNSSAMGSELMSVGNGDGNVRVTNNLNVGGTVNAGTFSGNGAGLTAKFNFGNIDVNTIGDNFVLEGGSTASWANRGPSGHNGGAILHVPTHPGGYYSDLWFDTANNRVYSRAVNGGGIGGWDQLARMSDIAGASVNYASSAGSASSASTASYVDWINYNNAANGNGHVQFMQMSSNNAAGDDPTNSWVSIMKMNHGDGDTYYNRTLAFDFFSSDIYTRKRSGGTADAWMKLVLSDTSNNVNLGTGQITANGFIYYSDVRLKKNIATIESPLTKILQLRGVTFNWKKDNTPGVGLIAQEVEKVFPELVSESGGIKSVQYGNLVAPLIEAVKEQQKEIQVQTDRANAQQQEIESMKAQIQMLQAKN